MWLATEPKRHSAGIRQPNATCETRLGAVCPKRIKQKRDIFSLSKLDTTRGKKGKMYEQEKRKLEKKRRANARCTIFPTDTLSYRFSGVPPRSTTIALPEPRNPRSPRSPRAVATSPRTLSFPFVSLYQRSRPDVRCRREATSSGR